ncbi:hypothetical protein HPB50_007003 [Hyalomma asiaticum]|uniref:Uncharacterized protein n=1 Tax=Hyalomma asiaticum TaxID=266040 RepID=A0ACB7SNF7_HYAAI|nr:hypothetical protein HPB50_007003 [Hyalomma asiaticum]
MGDAPVISQSPYARSLDDAARKRYIEKLKLCGDVDPLLLGRDKLHFDVELVPRVEISDIKDLVHATCYIMHEQMKARKSLEAHNYLASGFVQEPQLKKVDDIVIVCGKPKRRLGAQSEFVSSIKYIVCTCVIKRRFVTSGKPYNLMDDSNPDWAPSCHLGYGAADRGVHGRTQRYERTKRRRRKATTTTTGVPSTLSPAADTSMPMDLALDGEPSLAGDSPDEERYKDETVQTDLTMADLQAMRAENERLTCNLYSVEQHLSTASQALDTDNQRYGIANETKALQHYEEALKNNGWDVQLQCSGLFVNPAHPWLGASPDAIVHDSSEEQPWGCVEVPLQFKRCRL